MSNDLTCSYWAARLIPGQAVDLGVKLDMDGKYSFSIAVWLRLTATVEKATILGKGSELSFVIDDGQLVVNMANTPGITGPVMVEAGGWHYVVFTYETNGQYGGTLSLYIDGVAATPVYQSTAGESPTSTPFALGGDASVDILSATFWTTALPAESCVFQWVVPAPGPTLAAAYDFGQYPAADVSGNSHSITYQGDAQQFLLAPSLQLVDSVAQPSPLDGINPSDGQPFTIHGWVYPLAPVFDQLNLTLLGNGTYYDSPSGALACFLAYDTSAETFTWTVQWNGAGGPTLAASTTFSPATWHHVAVTYDGSVLTLYVDGAASGTQSVTLSQLAAPAVLVGGILPISQGTGAAMVFNGYVQGLGIWSVCLDASQIVGTMGTNASIAQASGCTAYFDLSTPQVANQVTGRPLALFNNADVVEQASPASQVEDVLSGGHGPGPRRAAASGRDDGADYRAFLASALPGLLEAGPLPEQPILSEQAIQEMVARFRASFSKLDPEQLAGLSRTLEQNLRAGVHACARFGDSVPGSFLPVSEGPDWVIYYEHPTEGRVRCTTIPGTMASAACIAWITSIVATVVGVVLSLLAVGYVASTLATAAQKVVTTSYGTLSLVIKAESANVQASTFIKVVQTLYATGSLTSVIAQGLANLSFWDWIFTVASTVGAILAMWLTGGLYLAAVLVQLGLSVARLVTLFQQRPSGC